MKTHRSATCSDSEFIQLYRQVGPLETARRLNIAPRNVFKRRGVLEKKYQTVIVAPSEGNGARGRSWKPSEHPQRLSVNVQNGIVLVGSDAHLWPGDESLITRAFIKFCKELKPQAVILNGDVMDFPNVSRHPPIGWETIPHVQDEVEHAQEILSRIEKATFKARKIWTLGNHDARFETRLATVAPEYGRVHGVHLRDHFPNWEPCWSIWVNDDTVIKHRFKGGVHAVYNNAVFSGKNIITGHLHSAKVTPFTDYNGTRYGVDTGCMAHCGARQFVDYTEDSPKNWVSAFCILTFVDGQLLWPELVSAFDDTRVQFRGKLITI